jgi:hypothetical protein
LGKETKKAEMTRSTRIIAGAAAVLLILAPFGWWFASPWWTLSRMRDAARAGDADALAAHVDFPALRASTREQLRPRLGPLSGLLAGPAVDALISPEALRLALLHGGAGATEGGSASDASGADERGGAPGRGWARTTWSAPGSTSSAFAEEKAT